MNISLSIRKNDLIAILLLFLLVIAVFAPIMTRMISAYDYQMHAMLAEKMLNYHSIVTPHFLYHGMTIFIQKIFFGGYQPDSISKAGITAVLCCTLATAAIVFFMLRQTLNRRRTDVFIAVSLLVVAPITLLAFFDHHLYFGYIGINVFHNPTIMVLKPFALISVALAAKMFDPKKNNFFALVLLSGLSTVLSALAKPSFLIAFLPALIILVCYKSFKRQEIDRRLFFAGFVLPAVSTLAWQYYLTYSSAQIDGILPGESKIILAPFVVMKAYSTWLAPKFLLSIFFPLAVTACYFREAKNDGRLVLSWIAYACGSFYTYFLAESGPRMLQGNFLWSAQIALFVLFVVSTVFFCDRYATGNKTGGLLRNWKAHICIAIFSLHLLSGVVFYFMEYRQSELYW